MVSIKLVTLKKYYLGNIKDEYTQLLLRCGICQEMYSMLKGYTARLYFSHRNAEMGICPECARKAKKQDQIFAATYQVKFL